jgi:hypothetical protein
MDLRSVTSKTGDITSNSKIEVRVLSAINVGLEDKLAV